AGLRNRPIRQEPPRRSQQVSADGARLRRVLWLPISPGRDVRSVLVLVPNQPRLLQQVWTTVPGPQLRDRQGRSNGNAALGQDRQAEDCRRGPAASVSRYVERTEYARSAF